ncbi:ankyrin repeat domain-containing protein 13C-like isoform X2 [Convolutriloba macropyga]|uniref:ankyrin repeat domain-containing protein 13C-like isoform X2 n=1 Tax=Convolutriloba macropyga TaxID=536237 RepID=UPI003F52740A
MGQNPSRDAFLSSLYSAANELIMDVNAAKRDQNYTSDDLSSRSGQTGNNDHENHNSNISDNNQNKQSCSYSTNGGVNKQNGSNNCRLGHRLSLPESDRLNSSCNQSQKTHIDSETADPSSADQISQTKDFTIEPLSLHRDVFDNNLDRLETVWKTIDSVALNKCARECDVYGLTAVHLALRLRDRYEYVRLFLDRVDPNFFRHNPTIEEEAVRMGDRIVLREILAHQLNFGINRCNWVFGFIEKIVEVSGDFFCQLTWKVSSWVPFVSRLLPRDTISMFKQGTSIRIDTGWNFLDLSGKGKKWGHCTLLYNRELYGPRITLIDRIAQKSVKFGMYRDTDNLCPLDLDERVDYLLKHRGHSDSKVILDWSGLQFTAQMRFGKFKKQKIGDFHGLRYKWSNAVLLIKRKNKETKAKELSRMFGGTFDEYMSRENDWLTDESSSVDEEKNKKQKGKKYSSQKVKKDSERHGKSAERICGFLNRSPSGRQTLGQLSGYPTTDIWKTHS